MIQSQCLERWIKSMKKVKSEKCKTTKINEIIRRDLKKTMSYWIEIFRIPFNYTKFNEKEIEKMKDKKGENGSSGPDHETGEKWCLWFDCADITNRTGNPVLDLKVNTPGNMNKYCSDKNNL